MTKVLKSILKSKSGFSMVETIVALGLFGAVAFVGLKQSEMMGNSSNDLNLEREIIDFQSGIEGLVNNTAACEASFKNKVIPFTITELKDKNNNTAYSSIDSANIYLENKLKINSMKVTQRLNNYFLEVNFEKLNEKSAMKSFSKFIELMIDVDAGNKIIDCFNIDNSMDETIQYLVSKDLCEKTYGIGTAAFNSHFDALNRTCSFDGFDSNLFLQCSSGMALTGINYQPSSNKFVPVCTSPFNSVSCPNGWVKSLNSLGQFECNSLSSYVNTTSTIMDLPATCKLLSATTDSQIKLICASNSGGSTATGNNYKCLNGSFGSGGSSCTPSSGGPSLCNSGATVNSGATICCASTPSSTCLGSTSSCTPKGCAWYQSTYGPSIETGCTIQRDDCGTTCNVTGSCNTSGTTNTCLMCNQGQSGTCDPSTQCCHYENGVLVSGPPCI